MKKLLLVLALVSLMTPMFAEAKTSSPKSSLKFQGMNKDTYVYSGQTPLDLSQALLVKCESDTRCYSKRGPGGSFKGGVIATGGTKVKNTYKNGIYTTEFRFNGSVTCCLMYSKLPTYYQVIVVDTNGTKMTQIFPVNPSNPKDY